MVLDLNYWATQKEKDYVKDTLDKEWVKKLFEKELNNLSGKIVRNFHNDNYAAFEIKKTFETEKKSIKDILNADPEMQKKYEAALAKNKARGGCSEGVLLLQALAIKCVTILANGEKIENKLASRNDVAFKSQAMDGILGPNTFYVLASIAKEKWIAFNGVADKSLLDTMINICKENPMVNTNQPAVINNTNTPAINTTVDNAVTNPVSITNQSVVNTNQTTTIDQSKTNTDINQAKKNLETNILQIETDFLSKNKKPVWNERIKPMVILRMAYEGLFKELTREKKKQKIEELEEKLKQYKGTDYQYNYYSSTIKSCKEMMNQEVMKTLETYTLNMIEDNPSATPYSFQKENNKNKIEILDPPLDDGTKYQIYIINGQRSPIPELKGENVDKTIFKIKFKEDGKTIVDNEYNSFQNGEEWNMYAVKNNRDNIISMTKTTLAEKSDPTLITSN